MRVWVEVLRVVAYVGYGHSIIMCMVYLRERIIGEFLSVDREFWHLVFAVVPQCRVSVLMSVRRMCVLVGGKGVVGARGVPATNM